MVGYMDRKRKREHTDKKKTSKSEVFEIVWLGSASMRCSGFERSVVLMVQGKNGIRFGFWSAAIVCLIH